MEPDIARDITAERLQRVVHGYSWRDYKGNERQEEGLGGGFRFATLGPTLFDETGAIQPEVTFDDLAAHIFFSETGQPLPAPPRKGSPFIGQAGEIAYYLFYNGVKGGSVLDAQNLKQVRHSGQAVVYADSRAVSPETLKMLNIIFKQIPYQVQTR